MRYAQLLADAPLIMLFIAILGLWKKRGWLIGMAAMFKMSPALYLAAWAARRQRGARRHRLVLREDPGFDQEADGEGREDEQ